MANHNTKLELTWIGKESWRDEYVESIFLGKTAQETAQETPVETTARMPVETPVKTPERILEVLRANPRLTLAEVAGRIGKSGSGPGMDQDALGRDEGGRGSDVPRPRAWRTLALAGQ